MGIYVDASGKTSLTSTPGISGPGAQGTNNVSAPAPSAPAPSVSAPAPSSGGGGGGGGSSASGTTTIYKMGSSMQVMNSDLPYYAGQGWSQTSTPTPAPAVVQPTPSTNQILDVPSMNKYDPSQYTRDTSGKVFLNEGVTPIAGTVKTGTPAPIPTDTTKPVTDATKPPAALAPEIAPEDKKWVNDLYQKYFDRTATSDELANWVKGTPQALEQFLGKEQKTYGYVSLEQKKVQDKNLTDALAIIDSSNLPPEIKSLWKTTVQAYPNAKDFNPQQIIDTFNKIKGGTIDPYYKQLADVAINDLKTNMTMLDTQRQSELEAERANAPMAIRQAQAGQEKAGMTFTGKGIETLGAQSAYAQQPSSAIATPVQTPFGGVPNTFYEGNVNQANRLIATSSAAKYAANQQQLGSAAEKMLGSSAVMSAVPGLTYAPSGTTDISATNVQEQKGKEASTLQGLINNWVESQKVYKNTTV